MSDYLEHHGIIGQKWGVSNGPPYPLDKKGRARVRQQARDNKKLEKAKKELAKTKEELAEANRKLKIKAEIEDKRRQVNEIRNNLAAKAAYEQKVQKEMDKYAKGLTIGELKAATEHLKAEKELHELLSDKKKVKNGENFVKKGLSDAGKKVITTVGIAGATVAIAALAKHIAGKVGAEDSGAGEMTREISRNFSRAMSRAVGDLMNDKK